MLINHIKLPKYIIHKGYSKNVPENTIESITQAQLYGAKWVEIDVNVLSDGTLIIFHDDYFLGKKISDYNFNEFYAQTFISKNIIYKPPLLFEALITCLNLKLSVNLDLKKSIHGNEKNLIELIHLYKNQTILLSSFYPEILNVCSKIDQTQIIGLLFDEIPKNWINIAKYLNVISIHVNYEQLNIDQINSIKKEGYLLIVYTVNSKNIANYLFLKGVDSIITDKLINQ